MDEITQKLLYEEKWRESKAKPQGILVLKFNNGGKASKRELEWGKEKHPEEDIVTEFQKGYSFIEERRQNTFFVSGSVEFTTDFHKSGFSGVHWWVTGES